MSNPFNFGNPVPPHQMVGRWDQIETITRDLMNLGGHSHIVIGGRRFGKSSFLEALQYFLLQHIDPTKREEWYVFPVLINLHSLTKNSSEGVFGLILNTLYKCFDPLHNNKALSNHFDLSLEQCQLHRFAQSKRKECALDEFAEILDEFLDLFSSSYGFLRLVFLLDEIEVGLDKDWTEILFSQLRSLIYQGPLRDYVRCVLAGSSRVIDVRDEGSPLLNMLNITYLAVLEEKDIQEIIHWASNVPSDVARAVLEQCGGHPFIAQYLMHHLWEMGISTTTVRSVMALTNKFIHERYADLEQWLTDIGISGQLAYSALAEANNWLTEVQVRHFVNTPEFKTGRGLITLCYHGLVIQDGTWSKYRISGQLFKNWFQGQELSVTFQTSANTNNVTTRPGPSPAISQPPRTNAFISYSHKDRRYFRELQVHLAPYSKIEAVEIWDDTKIQPGANWQWEIEKALQSAKVGIFLVSADFLASDFITNHELPSLLAAAQQEGVIIYSIILRPCAFNVIPLAQFQTINTPSNPLSKMTPGKRDEVWSKVAELVRQALSQEGDYA